VSFVGLLHDTRLSFFTSLSCSSVQLHASCFDTYTPHSDQQSMDTLSNLKLMFPDVEILLCIYLSIAVTNATGGEAKTKTATKVL